MWQPLATITFSNEWQFTPVTDAIYFRLRHLPNAGYVKGYFGQAYIDDNLTADLFDIKTIFPSSEGEIIRLYPIAASQFSIRQLAYRLNKRNNLIISNWKIQIDYMPISQTDLFSAVNSSSATINQTSVASVNTPVLIVAANASRKAVTVLNRSNQPLYIKLGAYAAGATQAQAIADSGIVIPASGFYEPAVNYTGAINGVWNNANGNAVINEFV
jgi:hypothetical protein